jgi:hypothetical protein
MGYVGPFPLRVKEGGTGEISLTAHAVLVGENASDIGVTNVGTNGQVLLGATAAAPAFATLTSTGGTITFTPGANTLNLETSGSSGVTLNGDVSSASGSSINVITGFTSGPYANGSIRFEGNGATTLTLNTTDANTNTGVGGFALSSLPGSFSVQNNAFGYLAGASLGSAATSGSANCLFGLGAGGNLDQGSNNCSFGNNTLFATTGSYNTILGHLSGQNLISSESSNVLINNLGVNAESNTLRIGSATGTGNQNLQAAYVCGIDGVNVGSVAKVVTMASDQLGTATITAGTGISVTPGANTITIANTATAGATTFHTGSGDATVSAGAITIAGGNNISTSGSGSTVTVAVSGTTNHTLQLGNASGSLTSLGAATNGQIPIGSTSNDPVLATITAGSGISITNGAGTITIANTSTGMTWSEVTGTSQAMAVNTGYILNNAGLVTATLPSTAAVGDVIRVTGKGAGGWRIAQNAGQTIYFGSSTTTTGATGRLDSTATRDTVELVCVTANNDFNVISSIGNITIT